MSVEFKPILEWEDYQFPTEKLNKNTDPNCKNCILISCGSFNPITFLHLRLFESAKDYLEKEKGYQVIGGYMSPVHEAYGKRKGIPLETNTHRISMCHTALEDSSWVMVDDWECKQTNFSRTLFVLQHFRHEVKKLFGEKQVELVLLCGADMLESMVKPGVWIAEQVEEILSTFGIACVERSNFNLSEFIFSNDVMYKNRDHMYIIPNYIQNDVSATKIRLLLHRNYSVKYYIHDKVIQYIHENKLYQ